MPNITVKNIPLDIYELLKQSAAANRRSINSEIIVCIERGVQGREFNVETTLRRARRLRANTGNHPIAQGAFQAAKRTGRP